MKQDFKYIQIIGTQRSGSNLLRVMLNQLPEIAAPHPPHILQNFMPIIDKYGDLENDANFLELIKDVCRFVEINPVPWTGIDLNPIDIFSRSNNRTIFEIFRLIYEIYAGKHNASIWCCKSMANIDFASKFEDFDFNPFYIYLFRDGRDVALSFKNAIVGEKHIYHLARKWKQDQDMSLDFLEKIDEDSKYILSYEGLIESPEFHLKQICDKLNINFDRRMLVYYNSDESKSTAISGEMWANLQKPIIKDNTKKYRKELDIEEIKLFESVAKTTLRRLGYLPDFFRNGFELKLSQEQIDFYKIENERLKLEAKKRTKKSDLEKRKPQADYLHEIKSNRLVNLSYL